MYICIYVYVYIYIYTYVYVFIHIYLHIYTCIYSFIHVWIRLIDRHTHIPQVSEIVQADTFWPAERYHQQYLAKGGQCALKGTSKPIKCYG